MRVNEEDSDMMPEKEEGKVGKGGNGRYEFKMCHEEELPILLRLRDGRLDPLRISFEIKRPLSK